MSVGIHAGLSRRDSDESPKILLTEYSNRMPRLNQTLGSSLLSAAFMACESSDVQIADDKQCRLLSDGAGHIASCRCGPIRGFSTRDRQCAREDDHVASEGAI